MLRANRERYGIWEEMKSPMRTVRSLLALGVPAALAAIAQSSCRPHVAPGLSVRAICGFGGSLSAAPLIAAHVTFENTTAAPITVSRYRVTWPAGSKSSNDDVSFVVPAHGTTERTIGIEVAYDCDKVPWIRAEALESR
jgi:hypothetical protein